MALITGIPTSQLALSLVTAHRPEEQEDRDPPEAPLPLVTLPLFNPRAPEPPMFRAGSSTMFKERISPNSLEQKNDEGISVGEGLLIAGAAVAIGAAVVFWPAVVAAIGGKGLFVLGALAVGAIAAACQPEIKREVHGYEINPKRTGVTDKSIPQEPDSKQSATGFHWMGKEKNAVVPRAFSAGMNLLYDETTKFDLCAPYRDPQGNPTTDPNLPHRMQDLSVLADLRDLEVTANCFHGRSTLDPFNRPFRFDAMPTPHQMRMFAPYDELANVVRGGDMQKNTLFCNQDQPLKTPLFAGGATCLTQLTDQSGNIHNAAQGPIELLTINEVDDCTTFTRPLYYGRDNEQSGPWNPSRTEAYYHHFWCWSAPDVLPGIPAEKFPETFDLDLRSFERTFCTTKGTTSETDCQRVKPQLEAIDRDWCLPTMRDDTVFRTLPKPPEEAPCFAGRDRIISDTNPARTYCFIERIPTDPGTGPGTNKPATFMTEKWPSQPGIENPHELFIQMTWCENLAAWERFRKAKDGE